MERSDEDLGRLNFLVGRCVEGPCVCVCALNEGSPLTLIDFASVSLY